MVRSRQVDLDAPSSRQLLEYCGCKLTSAVRCDRRRHAVVLNPAGNKCVDDGLCRDVLEWDGDWPTSKSVYRGQEMATSVRERERHKVEVDVVEPLVGDGKVAYRRNRMASDLGLLAREALACPSRHVLAHGGPHDFCANCLTRAFHARMAEAVDGIKDGLAEG